MAWNEEVEGTRFLSPSGINKAWFQKWKLASALHSDASTSHPAPVMEAMVLAQLPTSYASLSNPNTSDRNHTRPRQQIQECVDNNYMTD